ncbi:MAG: efflux RND transporter periplasmic adaptor subunit [Gemmatimonadota bacterium]|nr:efflux RND transporter periplasmic adaptor subunit [Gemmatimonadota bacterium]
MTDTTIVRSTVLLAALLGACALAGCSGEKAGEQSKTEATADSTKVDSTAVDTTAAAKKKEKKAPEGVPVKVHRVQQGSISSYMLYNAKVEAEETVDVYAHGSGLVKRVLAEEGDRVRAGEVVVHLVDHQLKLAEAEAQVAYRKLESNFKRRKEIYARNLLSKEEYERDEFDLEQARIRWQRAQLDLDHASVRSPISGIVAERMVKLGDRIGPTTRLYVLVNLKSLISRAHIPGSELPNIAVGQPARITTDLMPDVDFPGRIIRISPVVDPNSGTFRVTLAIDDEQGKLRPGLFVTTKIVTATHDRALLVPKRAIVYDDGFPHVFVVQDSTARKIQLDVGFEDTRNLEVLSGVSPGDSIVVVGQNGLKDQARVRVIEGKGLRIPARPDSTEHEPQESPG